MRTRVILSILPVVATACALPPDQPRLAVPPGVYSTEWSTGAPAPPAGQPAPQGEDDFWAGFGHPAIPAVVERSLTANPQLEVARARILAARGNMRIAGAALLPTVGASAGLTASRNDDLRAPTNSYTLGTAGLDIAYDVDLFGGARAGKRAAKARGNAAIYDAQATALIVQTDAARTLVQWAGLNERIAIADRNIASAQELLRIVSVRAREGAATRLDVGLQSTEVARLKVARSNLVEARAVASSSLAVLLGAEAPSYTPPPVSLAELSAPWVDPGQPGDLLFRRPDIQAAEARIAAARGDVQAARAAFKPGLRLSASALGQAAATGGPFGLVLTAGSSLIAPIFQGGRLRGNLTVATAGQLESVATYRQTLLTALGEGDKALYSVSEARNRAALLKDAGAVAHQAALTARRQWIEGEVDMSVVIDAQRNENATADMAALAQQDVLTATIDLFKALGGGPR